MSSIAECHQGYSSGGDVTKAVATVPEDEVNENLEYISAHYKVDGALRFGADAMIGYQYPGKLMLVSFDMFRAFKTAQTVMTRIHSRLRLVIAPPVTLSSLITLICTIFARLVVPITTGMETPPRASITKCHPA